MRSQAYSSVNVQHVLAARLMQGRDGQGLVVGVDVGKYQLQLVLRWQDGTFSRPIGIRQPEQIEITMNLLRELRRGRELVLAMEPSGRYGDVLRQACHRAGIVVQRVSAKASHDYAEVFDGVASQHDGKDAALIADLAAMGKCRQWVWQEPDSWQEELAMHADMVDTFTRQMGQWCNRVGAWVAAHWPEVQTLLPQRSTSLLWILAHYGSPKNFAQDPKAEELLRKVSTSLLRPEKVRALIKTAGSTLGVSVAAPNELRIQQYAREALRAKALARLHRRALVRMAAEHSILRRMAQVVGPATAGVLWVEAGNPADYSCGRAYLKALGMNLTEFSSGMCQGQRKISKRGSSRARMWLYFAALRAVRSGPVSQWYWRKVERDGGVKLKGVTAVTRKLVLALYRVTKDDVEYDPNRLFAGRRQRRRSRANAQVPEGKEVMA